MLFEPLIRLNNFLYKSNLQIFVALNNWAIKSLKLPLRPKLTKEEMKRLKEVLQLKTINKKIYSNGGETSRACSTGEPRENKFVLSKFYKVEVIE